VIPPRCFAFLSLLFFGSTLTGSALAQDISKWDEQEATQRFREGEELIRTGHAEEARRKFEESYAVFRDRGPKVLWNLAMAETDSDHPLEALGHFRHWMTLQDSSRRREDGEQRITALVARLGHLVVSGVAPGALSIDGKPGGGFPAELREGGVFDVLPGHHIVEALEGASSERREADVPPGGSVAIRFEPKTKPLPLSTSSHDGAIQGSDRGPSVLAGTSAWTTRHTVAVAFGGVALATAGFAIGFGVASQNDKSDLTKYQAAPSCQNGCTNLDDARSSERSHAQLANALYLTSGVLGVAAVGVFASIFLFPQKPSTEHAALLVPTFSRDGGGFAFEAHF
jgi:hypothetical protein